MKKRLLGILLVAVMAVSLAACGDKEKQESSADSGQETSADSGQETSPAQESAQEGEGAGTEGEGAVDASGKHHVEIVVKDYGTISVELDGDAAPITVENFLKLAGEGFYDGLTFHRIISGFMIQGGDPLGNGRGGSEEQIKGEFSKNGVENNLSHTRGAISMARSQMMDSASSQFFIVHADSVFLDGEYACFGYVTEGMEVVDAICDAITEEAYIPDSNNTVESQYQPVIESVKVID